jgi:hypothetical protein
VIAFDTSQNDTRLSQAVGQGNDELVRFLLAHGAAAKAQNSVALRAAAKRGDPQMLALMTSKGGDPSAALPDAVIFFVPARRATHCHAVTGLGRRPEHMRVFANARRELHAARSAAARYRAGAR